MTSGEQEEIFTYRDSGVDTRAAANGLARLGIHVQKTLTYRDGLPGRPIRGLGYYANVLDVGGGLGIAVSTDGVGTKLLVAEALGRYETIGIDCVAMNVNDIICVGAEPVAMLDYLGVGRIDHDVFEAIGRGLAEACRRCRITIPGGEIAQIGEMLRGEGRTGGLDLVGFSVGIVPLKRVLFGQDVIPGDAVIGIASSGLHSNGYTLARRVLAPRSEEYRRFEPALGRTLGEELLEPTALYVGLAVDLFQSGPSLHAVCHITGDGYLNLTRIEAEVGFELDHFPDPPPVFRLIQERGRLPMTEMFEVFNMGVGLCIILPEADAGAVLAAAERHGFKAWVIGRVTAEPGVVRIPKVGLVGRGGKFVSS
jgi:phosphoribosylformylglycinamidine cyclo-ligase